MDDIYDLSIDVEGYLTGWKMPGMFAIGRYHLLSKGDHHELRKGDGFLKHKDNAIDAYIFSIKSFKEKPN